MNSTTWEEELRKYFTTDKNIVEDFYLPIWFQEELITKIKSLLKQQTTEAKIEENKRWVKIMDKQNYPTKYIDVKNRIAELKKAIKKLRQK